MCVFYISLKIKFDQIEGKKLEGTSVSMLTCILFCVYKYTWFPLVENSN